MKVGLVQLLLCLAAGRATAQGPFRFGGPLLSQGDGIVLQAERAAVVWGFVDAGAEVTVNFNNAAYKAKVGVSGAGLPNATTWQVSLPVMPASFDVYNISATSGTTTISIDGGAMFGDVWICSGQSNMAYPLGDPGCWNESNVNCTDPHARMCSYGCVNNSDAEVAAMSDFDDGMRLYKQGASSLHAPDESGTGTGWKTPSNMGGSFSATCWFFGRDVYAKLASSPKTKRPIGLLATHVGGTPDQHWSSPDALAKCTGTDHPWEFPPNFTDSVLWNGMVVPLLHTVPKGAIWYQVCSSTTMCVSSSHVRVCKERVVVMVLFVSTATSDGLRDKCSLDSSPSFVASFLLAFLPPLSFSLVCYRLLVVLVFPCCSFLWG